MRYNHVRSAARESYHRTARVQRALQRVTDPVERLGNVDVPVLAETRPSLVLQWGHPRGGAGAQHQRVRPVLTNEPGGSRRVRGVGGHCRERVGELVAHPVEVCAGAGDTDHMRAGRGQRRGDCTAESAARPGHDRRRACQAGGCLVVHG